LATMPASCMTQMSREGTPYLSESDEKYALKSFDRLPIPMRNMKSCALAVIASPIESINTPAIVYSRSLFISIRSFLRCCSDVFISFFCALSLNNRAGSGIYEICPEMRLQEQRLLEKGHSVSCSRSSANLAAAVGRLSGVIDHSS
jgi:hypothetical protein